MDTEFKVVYNSEIVSPKMYKYALSEKHKGTL